MKKKETEEAKFVIKDLYSSRDAYFVVNNETTSLEDIYWSIVIKDKKRPSVEIDAKYFTEKEGKRYLKEIKRIAAADYKKDSAAYILFGKSKHDWDLYQVSGWNN